MRPRKGVCHTCGQLVRRPTRTEPHRCQGTTPLPAARPFVFKVWAPTAAGRAAGARTRRLTRRRESA